MIVGFMGMVLALLLQGVLLGRYALYFHLLRLDIVACWIYVLKRNAILLFGLRPVTRFAPVWLMMLLAIPLPYDNLAFSLGGGKVAAGAVTLFISGVGNWNPTGSHLSTRIHLAR